MDNKIVRLSTGNVHVFEYGRAVYISGRGSETGVCDIK